MDKLEYENEKVVFHEIIMTTCARGHPNNNNLFQLAFFLNKNATSRHHIILYLDQQLLDFSIRECLEWSKVGGWVQTRKQINTDNSFFFSQTSRLFRYEGFATTTT